MMLGKVGKAKFKHKLQQVTFSAVAIILMHPSVAAAENVTMLIDEDYKPYTYVDDNGEAAGLYVEILKAADAHLEGYEISFKGMPWKDALTEIENGNHLGIVPPYYRPEARPFISQYSETLLTEKVVVLCNPSKISGKMFVIYPDDLAGMNVGNNTGYNSPGQTFFDLAANGTINLQEEPDTATNIRKLVNGDIDCYIQDVFAANSALSEQGLSKDAITSVMEVSSETGHIGYSRDFTAGYRDDFVAAMNKTLIEMTANGEIDKILGSN